MESRANIGEAAISPMLSHFFSEGINFVDQPLASVWKDWLARTFLGLSLAHKRALIVTFSAVWYARNKLESEMNLVRASLGPAIHHAKWFAPPVDVIKVNFDSAFSLQTRQSISGVMCRDSEGIVLAACSFPHACISDAFMAEALSCYKALQFSREIVFSKVLVEGDSRTIVQKCQADSSDLSLISPVVADIKALVGSFVDVSFGFVPKTTNMAAHTLAQEGKVFACPMFWIEEAPPRTMLAAEKDCLALDNS
ncbi:hypothetical protein V6N11_063291 [Hibiscus sabdariffa]|uniref:RNase H type-1 domain-containing protein n=1 Tax=Hibiscus sabdariffa TaxID=183260 RepID=A0ABR2NGM5_9ROSI